MVLGLMPNARAAAARLPLCRARLCPIAPVRSLAAAVPFVHVPHLPRHQVASKRSVRDSDGRRSPSSTSCRAHAQRNLRAVTADAEPVRELQEVLRRLALWARYLRSPKTMVPPTSEASLQGGSGR